MKLSTRQIEQASRQFEGQAIPDDHPLVPTLSRLFGDHTFFLDGNGLSVVEPADIADASTQSGTVVNLANWSDANMTSLAPHEPEPTEIVVKLVTEH
jgi:hypothetical protein